jgi:hypothetical protein
MFRLPFLLISYFALLISATALPPYTVNGNEEGDENGADIAKSLINFFAANNIFTSDDGPDLVDQLVRTPFQLDGYRFRSKHIRSRCTKDGGFTKSKTVIFSVDDGGKLSNTKLFIEFEHLADLETAEYEMLGDFEYMHCRKLYRPTIITVTLNHA